MPPCDPGVTVVRTLVSRWNLIRDSGNRQQALHPEFRGTQGGWLLHHCKALPSMDLSSHNKPSPRPEMSTLIPHGSTRAPFVTQPLAGQTIIILHISSEPCSFWLWPEVSKMYNCRGTRSQGRRPGSLLVSTRPGAEACHPQPSPPCGPEAFPPPAIPAAGLEFQREAAAPGCVQHQELLPRWAA